MIRFAVFITAEAEQDMLDLFSYIAVHDSAASAEHVLNKDVFVHAVLDGRRDLQSLLERRLLR